MVSPENLIPLSERVDLTQKLTPRVETAEGAVWGHLPTWMDEIFFRGYYQNLQHNFTDEG